MDDHVLSAQQERILTYIYLQGERRPVLLSNMERDLGPLFRREAFNALVSDGVIRAEFPEARLGDSGRQFWDFAHVNFATPMTRPSPPVVGGGFWT